MPISSLNYGRTILQQWIKGISVDTAVDLGGGEGDDLEIVRSIHKMAHLFSIESNIHYVNALKCKGIETYNLDLERSLFPFADNTVDLVLANQILEHIKELFWVLHEATRILKVGGHLFVGIPNLASFHNRILLLFGKQPTCVRNHTAHIRGFTKNDFIKLINLCFANGFAVEQFCGSNFYPFPSSIASILSKLLPGASVSIFFLLKKVKEYAQEFLLYPVDFETNFYLGHKVHHVVHD